MKETSRKQRLLLWMMALMLIFGSSPMLGFAESVEQIKLTITTVNGKFDGDLPDKIEVMVNKGITWKEIRESGILPTTIPNEGYYFATWASQRGTSLFDVWDGNVYNENTTFVARHVIPKNFIAYKNVDYYKLSTIPAGISGFIEDDTGITLWDRDNGAEDYGFTWNKKFGFNDKNIEICDLTLKGKPENTGLTEPFQLMVRTNAGNTSVYLYRFEIKESVIENPDSIPDDFVKITFNANTNGTLSSSVSEETGKDELIYAVHKDLTWSDFKKSVPTIIPNEPYKVEESPNTWKTEDGDALPDNNKKVTEGVYFAQYKLDPIIPVGPEDEFDAPEGYATIEFDKGDQGEFAEGAITKYYVDINASKTLADLVEPEIVVNSGYVRATPGWSPEYKKDTQISTVEVLKFVAQYSKVPDIIPVDPNNPVDKPENYTTVTFAPGENGVFGKDDVKVYYVNPKASVKLGDLKKPSVTPNEGYALSGWDKEDSSVITTNLTATALYEKLPVIFENPENAEPEEGFVRITFKGGEHGLLDSSMTPSLKGQNQIVYDVKADQLFSIVPLPVIQAEDGWSVKGWLPALQNATETVKEATYVAEYTKVYNPPLGSITVTKVWKGGPEEKPVVKFQLYKDGVAYRDPVELKGTAEAVWKDLPLVDEQDKKPVYIVKEVDVPENYTVEYSTDGKTITNTWVEPEKKPETTDNKDKPAKKETLPQTGSRNLTYFLVIGAFFFVLGIFMVKRQKQTKA